jgi:ribonucleoside-diphosphate reductase alpha chain
MMTLTDNAKRVLEKRYLGRHNGSTGPETPEELFRRVAKNISEAELLYGADDGTRREWEEKFCSVLTALDFMPNSPTLMNAGTDIQQLSACFVLPIGDSMDAIFDSVKNAALIHKSGGGTGFSFSRLRPKDDVVQSTHGISSGPLSFMSVFDSATEAVKQGGRRRGANMAILRVDHPDISDFIDAKNETDRLNNFNLSVAVTEEFMEAVKAGSDYPLRNPRTGEEGERLSAKDMLDRLIDSAWRTGEPGIVFIDRINRDNPTPLVGEIESTNPCGEQPLLPYESCNLGSLNLMSFLHRDNDEYRVDHKRLGETVRIAVRFLDNVIDMNRYPLPAIEKMTRANRKIGLGVMGFADLLVRLGVPYDSPEAVKLAEELMETIQTEATRATEALAEERGPFTNFADSVAGIRNEKPRRNATVTTIAPTGTISIIAGVSSGVEPLFALAYVRNVMDNDELIEIHPLFESIAKEEGFYSDDLMKHVAQHGTVADMEEIPERWRGVFRTAHDITPEAHVRIQAAFQKHTDNAVSKTVNFPHSATRNDVKDVFMLADSLNCKGVTVYRDGCRESQVLSVGKQTCAPAPTSSTKPKNRTAALQGSTRRMPTGCGNLYVTINEEEGVPFELFAQMGKAGGCAASQAEAIGRLVSLALRAGVDTQAIVKQLRGVRCPSPAWEDGSLILSCSDAISKALDAYLGDKHPDSREEASLAVESLVNRSVGLCIDCGEALEFDGGCAVCRSCGFSRCG